MRVSDTSKWKINYLAQQPYHAFQQKPLLNDSLFKFDEISLVVAGNSAGCSSESSLQVVLPEQPSRSQSSDIQ